MNIGYCSTLIIIFLKKIRQVSKLFETLSRGHGSTRKYSVTRHRASLAVKPNCLSPAFANHINNYHLEHKKKKKHNDWNNSHPKQFRSTSCCTTPTIEPKEQTKFKGKGKGNVSNVLSSRNIKIFKHGKNRNENR